MSLVTVNELRESPLYKQMYRTRFRMSPQKRKETRNKKSELLWAFPHAAEREYALWIDKEFRENIVQPVNKYVLDNYLLWLDEFKKDSVHQELKGDSLLHKDTFAAIFQGIALTVRNAFRSISKIIKVGNGVDDLNSKDWDKFVKEATGVNMSLFDPQAQTLVQEWADLNHEFLSTLPTEYVNKINQIVSQGVSDGESKSVISEKINEAGKGFRGILTRDSQRRSERIARDQVGKLNSALSRSRMRQAKVDVYEWSTAADERVRGTPGGPNSNSKFSHYIMDRKFKQVDNSRKISDNGIDWRNVRGREEPRHAGQAINCRCTMIPRFIKLKTQVDKDIKQEQRNAA
jgi:hypothetical protein